MATRDEIVDIPVDDEHIAGTLVAPDTLIPGVLFVHGWGGSHQQYITRAREMAALGSICLVFDLRGHADTRSRYETVSRDHNLRDVVAAYDVLARRPGVDRSAIAVVGSSYGGYLAAILTSLRLVKWLSLRVPALYKDSEWEVPKYQLRTTQDLDAYRRAPVRPEESRALRACAAFTGDVLIVQSEFDDIVPPQVIANYREACTSARSLTFRTIEGADHGLADERSQHAYTAVLINWLSEMVLGARARTEPAQQATHVAVEMQAVAPPAGVLVEPR